MELAVVVLNWNAAPATLSCVTAIREWRDLKATVYLVDNASRPDDRAQLDRIASASVHLIDSPVNAGFAGGNNLGLRAALKDGAQAILMLNNDAVIEEADAARLLNTLASRPDIAAVGPLIYDPGSGELLNAGGREIAWHYVTHLRQVVDTDNPYAVDYVSGTVCVLRARALEAVGLFDERYFFSGEAADLCRRLRRHGRCAWRVLVQPKARAGHRPAAAGLLRETVYAYYTVRNRYLYVHWHLPWLIPVLYPYWLTRHLVHAMQAGVAQRVDTASFVLRGIRDGLAGRTGPIADTASASR